jgi:hypothetical protein
MINPKSCVTYRFETFATTTNKLIINVLQIDPQWPYFGVYIFLINLYIYIYIYIYIFPILQPIKRIQLKVT